jgi:hypothetical protein
VNLVLNLRVPSNAGKLSSGLTTRDLSSSAQLHRVSLVTNSLTPKGGEDKSVQVVGGKARG